jgi:MATE family multidrug resistance protein
VRAFASFAALFLFTSQGAAAGDVTLAANALLMTIISVTIYLLDGFAFAAEALVGRAVGSRDRPMFWRAVETSTAWAAVLAVVVGLVLWLAGPAIIAFSTRSEAVHGAALHYLPWAALSPILGVWCFQLDGIFTGATCTREMRNMMLLSVILFVASYWLLVPPFGNHGLWAAFSLLYVFRTLTLLTRMPLLVRRSFPAMST